MGRWWINSVLAHLDGFQLVDRQMGLLQPQCVEERCCCCRSLVSAVITLRPLSLPANCDSDNSRLICLIAEFKAPVSLASLLPLMELHNLSSTVSHLPSYVSIFANILLVHTLDLFWDTFCVWVKESLKYLNQQNQWTENLSMQSTKSEIAKMTLLFLTLRIFFLVGWWTRKKINPQW